MLKSKKQKAFTLVEIMMLLVISSLLVAASVPLVTKKHLHMPSSASHGSYMCYYKDGHLMEARKSGRTKQKMLAGYPRETSSCIFTPPAKASMFQVIAIGGGGGGGDAGYRGPTPVTYTNTIKNMSPWGLTNNSFIGIGVEDSEAALNEVKGYLGHLYGFAEGAHSGKAGQIDLATYTTGSKYHDCPVNKVKYKLVEHTKNVSTSTTLCSGYDGETTVQANVYYCYSGTGDDRTKVGGYMNYNGETANCSSTSTVDNYQCIYPNPRTYPCKEKYLISSTNHPAEYRTTGTYATGKLIQKKIECQNPCQYMGQVNCNNGPCYSYDPETAPCAAGISQCMTKAPWREDVYGERDGTCYYGCTNTKVGTKSITKEWTESAPSSVAHWGVYSGEGVTCELQPKGSTADSTAKATYYTKVADGCAVSTTTTTVNYTKSTISSSNDRGWSPLCRTSSVAGKLGLQRDSYYNFSGKYASDGDHINKGLSVATFSVDNPHSFCNDTGDCGPSIGKNYNGTYAFFKIIDGSNVYTARSNSATTGATGQTLERLSTTISNIFSSATADAINTTSKIIYYDHVKSTGSKGTNGSCESGSSVSSVCRPGSESYGYCLQHHGTSESAAEYNGNYKYTDTYDVNYLMSGASGGAGEFKTTIVRSLNGSDLTITIGRGGSAAALGLGQKGANGSSTSFGSILTANGGEGGVGSVSQNPVVLPRYNGSNYDFNKVKQCFTTSELDNDASCKSWRANPDSLPFFKDTSGTIGAVPTKKAVGGMFSFIMESFGGTNDETIQDLLKYAGRGGRGGGVQHFCWAGQYIIKFEGYNLYKSSIYRADNAPAGVPNNHKIPLGCQTSYKNVSAGAGFDGALIIVW